MYICVRVADIWFFNYAISSIIWRNYGAREWTPNVHKWDKWVNEIPTMVGKQPPNVLSEVPDWESYIAGISIHELNLNQWMRDLCGEHQERKKPRSISLQRDEVREIWLYRRMKLFAEPMSNRILPSLIKSKPSCMDRKWNITKMYLRSAWYNKHCNKTLLTLLTRTRSYSMHESNIKWEILHEKRELTL